MITLVTTTRNRPLCFSLCERWAKQQTVKWDQWIVVNDGAEPYEYTCGQEVVNRDPKDDTQHSICHNWLAALPLIKGDKIAVFEDDDFVHPCFLETLTRHLEEVDLIGIGNAIYFRLPSLRFNRMMNTQHASLAATAFRADLIPMVQDCIERLCKVNNSPFIDMYLWSAATAERKCRMLDNVAPDKKLLQLQFKNMPGARGIGIGHCPTDGTRDGTFSFLRDWIGTEAARVYEELYFTMRGT